MVFAGVALAVFVLELFLPVLVLSGFRKPVDAFTFNPWLSRLPEYLASREVPRSADPKAGIPFGHGSRLVLRGQPD